MVKRLNELGFKKVHNVNEDCYKVFASGSLPDHDVLISSPPYSGDHLERCLRFCAGSAKSWCLLLPNWVESKPYFKEVLGSKTAELFYISPVERYTYWMPPDLVTGRHKPDWVGQDGGTSPYHSTWYVYLQKKLPQHKIYGALEKLNAAKKDWVLTRTLQAARWKLKKMGKVARPPLQASAAADDSESDVLPPPTLKVEAKDKKRKKPVSADGEMKPSTGANKVGKKQKVTKHYENTVSFD